MEAAQIGSQLGRVNANNAQNLAHFLALTGDGKSALEWAKHAVKERNWAHTHMAMAVAFMALDDVVSAQKWLDSAKELVLKDGLEPAPGQWHQMYGRLQHQRGNLESAMGSYKRTLDIHERSTRMVRSRSCLFDMAQLEVDQFNPTTENQLEEHAGPFMQRYEESIADKDLPGHEAKVLMLKAELRMEQERHEESEKLIDSLIEATNCPALQHLHMRATETREIWAREGLGSARSRQTIRNR
jgi:tetratricopeptide (TPR) repeat protein